MAHIIFVNLPFSAFVSLKRNFFKFVNSNNTNYLTGLLHEGDEILAVNGMELRGSSVNDVCDIMVMFTLHLLFDANAALLFDLL